MMLIDAEIVRSLRLEKGWTQEQFAELCGLSVRTIQRIEKSGVASLESANALAAVLATERQAILARNGVRPARHEFSLKTIVLVAGGTFVLGIALGWLV